METALLACLVGIAISYWWKITDCPMRTKIVGVLAPILAILAFTGAFIAYDNFRVTGSVLTMRYRAQFDQYEVVPMTYFQPVRSAPEYVHPQLRYFYTIWNRKMFFWEPPTIGRLLELESKKFRTVLEFFCVQRSGLNPFG
jgi:hypothetical protein